MSINTSRAFLHITCSSLVLLCRHTIVYIAALIHCHISKAKRHGYRNRSLPKGSSVQDGLVSCSSTLQLLLTVTATSKHTCLVSSMETGHRWA